jgi:4-hydroxy-3-methylbut-2-enyl diphosphate reductase
MKEAILLAKYINGEIDPANFEVDFKGQYSKGFDVRKDLERIGVVNQTTMLASDTQAIADFLKHTMMAKHNLSSSNIGDRFADTRDTLCYATLDNQTAVSGMLGTPANLAIVVGGYNSSNTSHLVELCEEELPTFFISSEENILSSKEILHYNFHTKQELLTSNYLPDTLPVKILLTSGASCPDSMVENVIRKLASFYQADNGIEEMVLKLS